MWLKLGRFVCTQGLYADRDDNLWAIDDASPHHMGDSVTYNAQRISPSGFAWAAASPTTLPTSRMHSTPAAANASHRAGLRLRFMRAPSTGIVPAILACAGRRNQPD